METGQNIELISGSFILIIFLTLLFLLVRQMFVKGIIHFKLLKEIYPKELEGVKSYFGLMSITKIFRLDFATMFWFWFPVYYTKTNELHLNAIARDYHLKLKKCNRILGIYLFSYIVFICFLWVLSYLK